MRVPTLSLIAAAALVVTGTTAETQPDGTIWMTVQHEVSDYDAWRAVFDSGLSTRISAGELSFAIIQDTVNPNDVTAVFEWRTQAQADAFVHDPSIRNAMAYGGVISEPVVTFSQEKPSMADMNLMVATHNPLRSE